MNALIAIVVLVIFWKQVKGIVIYAQQAIERRLPLSTRVDRTISTLKYKRGKAGYTMRDVAVSMNRLKEQIRINEDNERLENLNGAFDKLSEKYDTLKAAVKDMDKLIKKLNTDKAYMEAIESINSVSDTSVDVDEIYAEMKVIEDTLDGVI